MTFSDMTHDEMISKLRIVTQERDGLREQLEAAHRVNETWGRILKATRSEAIMRQREHAAILADANAARAKAEQERDQARNDAKDCKEMLTVEKFRVQALVDKNFSIATLNTVYETALGLERKEADTLRRQVEAMSAPIAAACGRFGHLDMVLEMAHDPDGTENTNPWHACARDLWRAVKAAKEAGSDE
jgi:hypothetical protein